MYPPSKREALLGQLQSEKAIADLSMLSYRNWLPSVQAAMFRSLTAAAEDEVPPDPNAIPETQPVWDFLLDNALLYGLGLLYGAELLAVYAALGDGDEPPATSTPDPVQPVLVPPGVPSPAELQDDARRIVAKRLGETIEAVADLDDRLSRMPSVRQLQSDYLAGVRNRMVGTPDSVFRDIARDVDAGLANGDSPLVIRDFVQKQLDIQTGDWPGRATTVARTEAVGAQSAATLEAAQLQAEILGEENLEQVWLCTIDSKTRRSHFAADGQRVPLGGRFKVGRAELRHPGDASGPADETINCRCRVAVLAADENLPGEDDRHTERGPGDSTVRNREGSQADEIARRAEDGVIRARDDEDGVGSVSASARADARLAATEPSEEKTVAQYRTFTSVLAVIGIETDDGRMFASDIDLTFRDMPLPLMWQKQSDFGHFASFTVGVIESAVVEGTQLLGKGYLLNTAEADEAATQIEHKVTGPSVDLGDVSWVLTDENGNEVDYGDLWDNPDMKVLETITAGKLLGATLVSIPAFGQTTIQLGELEERGADTEEVVAALVASVAAGYEVSKHPESFFADPEFAGPTMPHMTADGRIMGHLAVFNQCHIGIQDRCVMAPKSQTNYAWFHTAPPVATEEGGKVPVGRLTVGGGHAAPSLGVGPTVAHYDDAGTCFALVHVGEDEHGIWFSGVPAPGATGEQIAKGLAAPLSGDWRMVGGNLELVAALSVNTPGFPLIASGATDAHDVPLSLVASLGPCRDTADGPQLSEKQLTVFAKALVGEMRAADRRAEKAKGIIAAAEKPKRDARRTAALDLISKVGG